MTIVEAHHPETCPLEKRRLDLPPNNLLNAIHLTSLAFLLQESGEYLSFLTASPLETSPANWHLWRKSEGRVLRTAPLSLICRLCR